MRYLVMTGLSGAGKTVAARHLEDMGAFCVDNLPPVMALKFIEACETTTMVQRTVVLAMDIRSGEFFDAKAIAEMINEIRGLGYRIETLFLEANDETLVSRYKETRRDHPLARHGVTLMEAIHQERELLAPLRETAAYVIDTTGMRPRTLQRKVEEALGDEEREPDSLRVQVMSFGFKRGLPRDADLVYDVRFLPNPFYIDGLGSQTGLDEDVIRFVMDHPVTVRFMEKTRDMLEFLLPGYREEGKHRLVIAVGCTGGAHRSVAIAESIGAFLKEKGYLTEISHRDLQLEQAHWKALREGDG